ncbi:MAG TPA: choice-of-anchor J domain-containing protein, partial [Chitinophagales bacterium]|nr:choice-of-anchor J domain-containing protein [Chitinophagales bacterium]
MRKVLYSCYVLPIAILLSFIGTQVKAQNYTENFDNITTLTGNGWVIQNNSNPLGTNSWFQGTATTATPDPGPFNAYNGADNAYIAANFASTTGGTGVISNWLVTPNRTLRNGDVFTFYTRKPTIGPGQTDYPDRLEVRLSTNGASTNVGATATAVGDFTSLLLSINPTLVTNVYPQTWTQYTITISGLPAPTSGRIAFRYFVTSAGPTGSNSDYIGIDAVNYTAYVCPTLTLSPSSLPNGTAGSTYNQSMNQIGALGAPGYSVTAGALPPGVTLSNSGAISGTPTATGTFNFSITVTDASGCSGTASNAITVVCPTGVASLSLTPDEVCSNDGALTLTGGSPAGGTYSGTGVTGGQFDPASGTQTITYTYIDPYGCTHTATDLLTVNTAPTVTLAPFAEVCSNITVTLSGGSPAGGTYGGTGVSAGTFNGAAGSQSISYTYTDANGCSNTAVETLTVNTAPTVDLGNDITQCGGTATLNAANAGADFDWSDNSTNQTLAVTATGTYAVTVTDANTCTATDEVDVTINTIPTVDLGNDITQCGGSATLDAANAGADFEWSDNSTNQTLAVTATGTYSVTVTDANTCTATDEVDVTINTIPTVDLGNDVTQCGGTATLDAANAGADFEWSDNSTNQTLAVTATGTYSVTVTDANTC